MTRLTHGWIRVARFQQKEETSMIAYSLTTRKKAQTSRHMALERLERRQLLSAGDVDLTFGGAGIVTDDLGDAASAVVVQSDSKVVVGGTARSTGTNNPTGFGLIRYNANGTLDTTFDGDSR